MFPGLGDLELLAASYRNHAYALHTHPTYVFGVVTAGVEQFRTGRTVNLAAPGSILVVNPEEPHDGEKGCEAGWSYRTCYPSPRLMREVADELELDDLPMFASAVLPAPDLARGFLAAHGIAAGGPGGDPGCGDPEGAMLTVLAAIVRRFAGARVPDAASGAAAGSTGQLEVYDSLIAADLTAPLRLAALAGAAGVTRFQVIRDFRHATGMTPGRYVRDRRVRKACELIGAGLPLAAIAADAGFADQSHMTRAFKTVKGVTPAAYRQAVTG